jgi:hypothetical protein
MHVISTTDSDRAILATEIDDLLLRARGLVLVRDLLIERGASRAALDVHTDELERVRGRLADIVRGDRSDDLFGEAA